MKLLVVMHACAQDAHLIVRVIERLGEVPVLLQLERGTLVPELPERVTVVFTDLRTSNSLTLQMGRWRYTPSKEHYDPD